MKKILLIITLLVVAIYCNAQEYNDAAIFDLKGNVKTCTIVENSSVTKLTFDRSGKLISSDPHYILTHDASGNVTSSKCGSRIKYYTYDSQGRVISEKDKDGYITTIEYNSEGQITKIKGKNIDFSYIIQSTDSHGNWIKRKSFTHLQTDDFLFDMLFLGDLDIEPSVFSRTIEYYSATSSSSSSSPTTNKPSTPSTTSSYTPSKQTFTVNGVSFTMVRVEGGTFTMGATSEQGSDAKDSEKPAHQVTLSSYSIGETEVTQELWEAVMGKNPSTFKGNKRPVENVSWDDCKVFIQKLNEKTGKYFRLPTEAEWEFAARGGVRSRRYKYSGSNDIDAVAWYDDTENTLDILDYFDDDEDVQNGTHIVKTKQANELGLYDMSGNVCEWCSDFFGDYNSSTQTNPKGASSGDFRVLRGGSWNSKAKNCRNSVRDYVSPQYHNKAGLRLVLSESYTNKPENITEKNDNIELDSPSPSKQTFTVNDVSFTMVRVDGGTFTMGATSEQGSDAYDDEKPAHQVTLSTYSIGETEVTQELWQAVMGSNPSNFYGNKRPVERVSWNDCQDFINKLNEKTGKTFRLPTEAEWEFAARGGNLSKDYKYSGSNTIGEVAWYDGNSGDKTHDVASKQSNELGLYDMSGNVYEWCQDLYDKDYYSNSLQTNPKGPNSGRGRVCRGGSWVSDARLCRSSLRYDGGPGDGNGDLGLRLVLSE